MKVRRQRGVENADKGMDHQRRKDSKRAPVITTTSEPVTILPGVAPEQPKEARKHVRVTERGQKRDVVRKCDMSPEKEKSKPIEVIDIADEVEDDMNNMNSMQELEDASRKTSNQPGTFSFLRSTFYSLKQILY